MVEDFPEVAAGSTNKYQNWEVVDPEKWVPAGYVCVRVDSRGTGRSPGYVDLWSTRETRDLYESIEWAAAQPWCDGKVGTVRDLLLRDEPVAGRGARSRRISSPSCPWEGANDWYREFSHHGGILCEFGGKWYPRQVSTSSTVSASEGRGAWSPANWWPASETLTDDELACATAPTSSTTSSRAR